MERIELLAPSGDLERLKIALLYGADAVYIGGQDYSLRANALNFSLDDIKEACLFAHKMKKRVYVTVNIVFHDKDLKGLEEYLKELDKCEVDAIIVSDVVVMDLWRKLNLKMELHVSTQASSLNYEAVKFYKDLGATRVVLAREASKEDIKRIKDETGIELECFVHGAMCTSISGRCVLSNYATNRDSNRGGCAQVCRFAFDLDKKRCIDYSIATKDLNLSSYISDLIEMKVASIKIEGRMRSAYYIATIISCYRKLIDAYYNNRSSKDLIEDMQKRLYRVANRESTSQYFDKDANVDDQYYIGREEVSNQDFLGFITDYDEDNKIIVLEERNYFKKGDSVVIFTPSGEEHYLTLDHIYDNDMTEIENANHPKQIVKIKYDKKIEKNSMMRVSF
jgi:putative protease